MNLEDFSKEELIWWLREKQQSLQEYEIIIDLLQRRKEAAAARNKLYADGFFSLDSQCTSLIEPYKDLPPSEIPQDIYAQYLQLKKDADNLWEKGNEAFREAVTVSEEITRLLFVHSDQNYAQTSS